jgi:hypothetical protein
LPTLRSSFLRNSKNITLPLVRERGGRGKRAMQAMLGMVKLDIGALKKAYEGGSA